MVNLNKTYQLICYFIFILTIGAVGYSLYHYNIDRFYTQSGDSAGFVDLIRVVAATNTMNSGVFSSAYSIFPLLSAKADEYCNNDLINYLVDASFFQWHSYIIAYLFSLPLKISSISALEVSSFVNVVNFVGVFAAVWFYLRKNKINKYNTLVFLLILSIFPVWSHTIDGQFYFDRLYVLPCLLLILFYSENYNKNTNILSYTILFIICLGISERPALLTSLYLIMLSFLKYYRLSIKHKIFNLCMGFCGILYVVIYMKYFQNSFYYNAISFQQMIANLEQCLLPSGTLFYPTTQFFMTLLPMLILCSFIPINIIIVLVFIIPNLIISVGGAEKTGFSTHYHAGYLPFIIAYAVLGYVEATRIFSLYAVSIRGNLPFISSKFIYHCQGFGLTLLIISICFYCAIWTPRGLDIAGVEHTYSVYKSVFLNTSERKNIVERGRLLRLVASKIPQDAIVSTPEFLMPALVSNGNNTLDYFPIGLGNRNYIVASYVDPLKLDTLEIPSFNSIDEKLKIAKCLQEKLNYNYQNIDDFKINGGGYIIYKKLN